MAAKRSSRRAVVILAALVLSVATSGCASVKRLAAFPDPPQVYGGLRTHIKQFPAGYLVDYDQEAALAHGVIFFYTFPWLLVDLPVSLAIDTVALPVTLWAPGSASEADVGMSSEGEDDSGL